MRLEVRPRKFIRKNWFLSRIWQNHETFYSPYIGMCVCVLCVHDYDGDTNSQQFSPINGTLVVIRNGKYIIACKGIYVYERSVIGPCCYLFL